ncbi:MAG: riboflavin biosynthesis protein RibF [Geobacteraceae bacterium GWC2_55_20]|nr:MAG: riboflavin biosynthesis protein RibF [Geobacteraceae bacterium GWC2_55_20]OGU20321.1 MAG: riboflavin biosynthesis protein RibF [Geobacteraceae bacterium GWF2_54_21]HBA73339.1 riboflavin biosynthesis protein RibF [Geobacter sp.]HCE67503.1 riboflavin biosynthesis protein RibF [Geobacter sp.]
MRIITGLEIFNKNFDKSVVTIGNFDGVHLGHVELFRRLKASSHSHNLPSVAVTFEPHPLKVLAPESAPGLITTFEQKVALISDAGVDCLAVVPFTIEMSQMTAESFVTKILCESLGMRHLIIGHDYAFGRGREGNYDTLERLGLELGFTLEDLEPVGDGEMVFSSTLVRSRMITGDMAAVSKILGRYHMISGTVVHGREIGHTIGFPTANISTRNELIPPDGVYAVIVMVDGRLVKGACDIGINPTFEGGQRTVEVFLLDFAGQIYGSEIAVYFVHRLRDVKKFPGAAELVKAIENDVEATRTVLDQVQQSFIKPKMMTELP